MADQQQQIPNAPFPAPPPFWKHFTAPNLSRLEALKDKDAKPEDIPSELRYLEPPSFPTDNYTVFGEEQTLTAEVPSLSSRGVEQLYPDSPDLDHPAYLLRVVRSLHLNFAELMTIFSQNPSLAGPKLEDIKNLFQNAHWLINMYRPHQARETLIALMEEQIGEGRREVEECERLKVRVHEALREVDKVGKDSTDGGVGAGRGTADAAAGDDEQAKRLWKMMMDVSVEAD